MSRVYVDGFADVESVEIGDESVAVGPTAHAMLEATPPARRDPTHRFQTRHVSFSNTSSN